MAHETIKAKNKEKAAEICDQGDQRVEYSFEKRCGIDEDFPDKYPHYVRGCVKKDLLLNRYWTPFQSKPSFTHPFEFKVDGSFWEANAPIGTWKLFGCDCLVIIDTRASGTRSRYNITSRLVEDTLVFVEKVDGSNSYIAN